MARFLSKRWRLVANGLKTTNGPPLGGGPRVEDFYIGGLLLVSDDLHRDGELNLRMNLSHHHV